MIPALVLLGHRSYGYTATQALNSSPMPPMTSPFHVLNASPGLVAESTLAAVGFEAVWPALDDGPLLIAACDGDDTVTKVRAVSDVLITSISVVTSWS